MDFMLDGIGNRVSVRQGTGGSGSSRDGMIASQFAVDVAKRDIS